jgi:hypothetical protein
MFDQILESYRRATESSMLFQQMMLRNWTEHWPQAFGVTPPKASLPEQVGTIQKKLGETITEMLNKHRETLDAQYRAGIKAIEDAFRVAEAKDPQQFRKLTEELWRHNYECLKSLAESQMRDIQAVTQKWFDLASQGAAAVKK